MEELTGRQKRFLVTAWKECNVDDDYWFGITDVSSTLNIDDLEARDTLFAITRQQKLLTPSQRLHEPSRELVDGFGFTKVGREVARHLVDEAKKAKRTKTIDFVKTFIWPIVVAVVVTWINNGIKAKPISDASEVDDSTPAASQPVEEPAAVPTTQR